MALEWAIHDRTAEDDFKFDQMIGGLDVCDRMALVRAGYDRTVTNGSRINWDSVFLLKQYFWDSRAYIAPIDEPFVALESWWRPRGAERLQERFQRAFVRILGFFNEKLLYKDRVVSFSCIDFVWFSHTEAYTPYRGRLEADPCIYIVFLVLFLLSSCCNVRY